PTSSMATADASTVDTPRMPDTYLVIGGVVLFVFLISFFVTPGQFSLIEKVRDGATVSVVDPDSFRYVETGGGAALFSSDGSPALFNALYEGLVSGNRMGGAVGIMAFILLVGGAFGIVLETGAITRGLHGLVARGASHGPVLLAGLFLAFSLGGAIFGMSEEVIPFVLMLLPVLQRLGYDNVTCLLVTYVATQVGFATSWMNPFSVAIAQGIAELPLLSGLPLRLAMWTTFTLFGVAYTLRYAARARTGDGDAAGAIAAEQASTSTGDLLVLLALLATVVWIIWGVVFAGYYLPEIATQFVVLGVAAGVVGALFRLNGLTANGVAAAFRRGAMDILPAALVVGFARGIVFLMGGDDPTEPSLLNTLLHFGSETLGGLPAWLAAWGMFVGQAVFNFFVTSGSGQAALTMPLMAPLSDLIGVTRQVAVLAFQLGDGLTNMIVPTSAALMGCLGAARIEWVRWVRLATGFFLLLFALASVFVIAAALGGYR
ncbi:MAG TPA: putative basic amino acid antiporter YfcC, partial [Steroidobacteraceae bacterium]|nr:putative basic amino acid antiporter YfcC [Steroidobacteraceae bacterium]